MWNTPTKFRAFGSNPPLYLTLISSVPTTIKDTFLTSLLSLPASPLPSSSPPPSPLFSTTTNSDDPNSQFIFISVKKQNSDQEIPFGTNFWLQHFATKVYVKCSEQFSISNSRRGNFRRKREGKSH